jgi:hypothetical protein
MAREPVTQFSKTPISQSGVALKDMFKKNAAIAARPGSFLNWRGLREMAWRMP